MTKYRIKDEAIEKAVRELFKTEEIYQSVLNDTCDKHFRDYFRGIVIEGNSTQTKMGFRFSIGIAKMLIEEVVEYDPKKWNEYPKVTPPKEGWYRVEHDYQDEVIHRAMYWDGENWLDQEMVFKRQTGWIKIEKGNPRFKPWDDEGDEE